MPHKLGHRQDTPPIRLGKRSEMAKASLGTRHPRVGSDAKGKNPPRPKHPAESDLEKINSD